MLGYLPLRMEHPVLLGEGTFSRVYLGTDSETKKPLVCKVLNNQAVARREKELLMTIKHPLFPKYVGYCERGDMQYLLMEYIGGCNLRQYVGRRGALSPKRGVAIVMELAEGLLYLHEQVPPLVYRDIKPENVMLQQDGRVRLVDVGCACSMENEAVGAVDIRQRGNCRIQTLAGSIGYAAPEQFVVGEGVGVESDVYALGGLLYFLLTGREPCEKEALEKGMAAEKIPRKLRRIILDAMQRERHRRIPDMRLLMKELSVYTGEGVVKRIWEWMRAGLAGKKRVLFYYEENIWH